MLVVTPRPADKNIIDDCIKNVGSKLFFKTWTEIAQQLQNTQKFNPTFILSQFIEYGKLSGEFMNMQPTNADISTYVDYYKNNVESKIRYSLENSTIGIDYSKFDNSIKRVGIYNHWGRIGYEYEFTNSYGMWFFYGVYVSSDDHGIKFKEDSEPEIAFFFDIDPKNRDRLKKNEIIKGIFDMFKNQGFEENLFTNLTPNKWRLLAYRTPLSKFGEFSVSKLREKLIEILGIVFSENFKKVY